MSNEESAHEAYEQVLRGHHELRGLLAQLHRLLADRAAAMTDIASNVSTLQQRLQEHFRIEEEGGYFVEAVDLAPRVSDRVAALEREHSQLLRQIQELHRFAGYCSGAAGERQKLEVDFHEFSGSLMRHENVENELLQEVFNDDIGSND
jgi:iron-sulfur cluster repair protein YtfE (RIC family)